MWNTDSGIPVFYYPHKSISAYPNMATKYLTATNFNPRPKLKKKLFGVTRPTHENCCD